METIGLTGYPGGGAGKSGRSLPIVCNSGRVSQTCEEHMSSSTEPGQCQTDLTGIQKWVEVDGLRSPATRMRWHFLGWIWFWAYAFEICQGAACHGACHIEACHERHAKERHAKERNAKERHAKKRHAKERQIQEWHAKQRHARQRQKKEWHAQDLQIKERHAKESFAKERQRPPTSCCRCLSLFFGVPTLLDGVFVFGFIFPCILGACIVIPYLLLPTCIRESILGGVMLDMA
ncbi:hypothetical protein ACHQM5_015490 [Ranunculus cassubicifolius]